MKRLIIILVMIFAPQCAMSQNIATVQRQIEAKAKQNKSLVANFVQTRYVASLAKPAVSEGKLYFLAPDKMRWEQTDATPFVLVVDGSKATVKQGSSAATTFDISTNVIFKELASIISGGITGSIFSDTQNYAITFNQTANRVEVTLVPKNRRIGRYVASIEMSFNSDYLANRITIAEAGGNKTVVDLRMIKSNVSVPLTLFDLK